MGSNLEEQLLASFLEASGQGAGNSSGMDDLTNLMTAAAGNSVPATEPAALESTASQSAATNLFSESASDVGVSAHSEPIGSTAGGGLSAGSIASTILEGGLGIVPLITGLVGLFGGGDSAPQPLEKYEMPSAISFTSALSGNGLTAADFDQMGSPRPYDSGADVQAGGPASGNVTQVSGSVSGAGGGSISTPITVSVQTMDAQSFLDNSDQIAQAVRGAMLNLSSINDVINDM